tara:strand:+ start:123 stop:614 length:492 start_codon:yes stop_codon:yes gene_type:complete
MSDGWFSSAARAVGGSDGVSGCMRYAVGQGSVAGGFAAAVSLAGVLGAQSTSAWFRRSFGTSGRTAFVTMPTLGVFYLYAEHALHDCQLELHALRAEQRLRDNGLLTESELTVSLRTYYEEHNPERVKHAATIAQEYTDKQGELDKKLRTMYGAGVARPPRQQ